MSLTSREPRVIVDGHGGDAVDVGLNWSPTGTAPPLGSEMKRTHPRGETHGEISPRVQTHGEVASSYPASKAYDAETEVILEHMRVFYSRFNPSKAGQVNNSKQAKVERI